MSYLIPELGARPMEALLAFKVLRRDAGMKEPYHIWRDVFDQLRRQKSSKVHALPCGFFLVFNQIHLRLGDVLGRK